MDFLWGDFIRVEGNLGRVSERGLFHTEIQTPDRELITLPNLFLVTHPVATIRGSGTIVSATVSLGYDVPRARVQELLTEAAREVGLEEPFIQVLELGDYAVTYRVAGLLTEIKTLISTRSQLRMATMDALHRGRIEIVSPAFRYTRALSPERCFIPEAQPHESVEQLASPESTVFDKADEAEKLEKLCERYKQLEETIERLATEAKESEPAKKEQIEHQLEEKKKERDDLAQAIEQCRGEDAGND